MGDYHKEKLINLGVDIEEGIERFVGNESMYIKFLVKFKDDPTFETLKKSVESGSNEEIYRRAHTLKGIAGNLSIKSVYKKSIDIMDCVRNNNENIKNQMEELDKDYNRIVEELKSIEI